MRRLVVLGALCGAILGCGRRPIERLEWPVMGTVAAVQVRGEGANEVRVAVQQVFADIERLLNAHDPQSELSKLSKLSDVEILARCDARVRPCYAAAFDLREKTHRAFNPRWRGDGTMDLGAIAKGFAVDLAAVAVANIHRESDVLIDLGGNLKAVRGNWTVGIAGTAEEFELDEGSACATSGTYFRGQHIKDGRTGEAASSALHAVTVIHPGSAMWADGLSTTMFILGRERGEELLRTQYPSVQAVWDRR